MSGNPWCDGAALCLGLLLAAVLLAATPLAAEATTWLGLALAVLLGLALALIALVLWRDAGTRVEQRPRSPEAALERRFARGDLTRQQYREALIEILKGRYVWGELDLRAYEARLDELLDDRRAAASGSDDAVPPRPAGAVGAFRAMDRS